MKTEEDRRSTDDVSTIGKPIRRHEVFRIKTEPEPTPEPKPVQAPQKEPPIWVQNEQFIIWVKLALGGDNAVSAFKDYLFRGRDPSTASTVEEIATVLAECLRLERVLDLEFVEKIVLHWIVRVAQGLPIDYRAYDLIGQWSGRRIDPPGKGGRGSDSLLKQFAVRMACFDLAKKYSKNRGAKKQMYYELQTKFGLGRSQLIKLLSDFDPWTGRPSDKLTLGERD